MVEKPERPAEAHALVDDQEGSDEIVDLTVHVTASVARRGTAMRKVLRRSVALVHDSLAKGYHRNVRPRGTGT